MIFLKKFQLTKHLFFRAILYGIIAGLIAVLFQNSIHYLFENGIASFAKLNFSKFLIYSFISIVGTAFIAGIIVEKISSGAAGSGSPQLKLNFWKDFGCAKWKDVWTKFIASVLSIGGGSSLGNEGPMVKLGGNASSSLAELLGIPSHARREASAAGAAAGLAAIFNAPMAAVAFVLEEIIENLNSRFAGVILIAAVSGALVAHFFIGTNAIFSIPNIEKIHWSIYIFTPIVAIISTLIGIIFQKFALNIRSINKKWTRTPISLRITIGAILCWIIGILTFYFTQHLGVFSLGYSDLTQALNGNLNWQIAAILLIAKLIATALCYGFSGCGGIFAPTLFLGGTCGAFIAGLLSFIFPEIGIAEITTLSVVGMCACFTAVIRAPITGILLVFEMTHSFVMVPALMIGGITSISFAKFLTSKGFYDAVLSQDNFEISKIIPPRDFSTWQKAPLSRIAHFSPISIIQDDKTTLEYFINKTSFSSAPVINKNKEIIGIFHRKDFLSFSEKISYTPPISCAQTDSIALAENTLIQSNEQLLPIVDEENHLVAILTLHDLLRNELHFSN